MHGASINKAISTIAIARSQTIIYYKRLRLYLDAWVCVPYSYLEMVYSCHPNIHTLLATATV